MRRIQAGPLLLATVSLLGGCERTKPDKLPVPSATQPSASPAPRPTPSIAPGETRANERDEAKALARSANDAGEGKLGELADVGPAGPASASRWGVVMVTRDDKVVIAKLGAKDGAPLEPVEQDGGAFTAFARGPSIAGDHAYWISKGRLVRRKLPGDNPLEVLAEGARPGTRVAAVAPQGDRPAAAAYITNSDQPGGDPVAMLWMEGRTTERLSPEGSAASSVALAADDENLFVTFIEGRSGMSPVHARRIRHEGGKVVLGDDVVVWVGGSAQALTEIVGGVSELGELWAFVPMERDATRFGLAELRIGEKPKMGVPVTWRSYPNGLDPAPITSTKACGKTLVAYARPAEAKPGAPQELHLASLDAVGLTPPQVVARSRGFANISLASLKDGALVAYVADHRTWSIAVDCPARK